MAEMESIREIARRLIVEHRAKKQAPISWLETLKKLDIPNPAKEIEDAWDKEWLRQMRISND